MSIVRALVIGVSVEATEAYDSCEHARCSYCGDQARDGCDGGGEEERRARVDPVCAC